MNKNVNDSDDDVQVDPSDIELDELLLDIPELEESIEQNKVVEDE